MDDASVKKAFAEEVDRAVKLRDFLGSERHSYHVPDVVIEAIEAAREIAMSANTPTAEQRASLAKAYRDLVGVPDTAVTYSGIGVPPLNFWGEQSPWLLAFVFLTVIPTLIIFLLTGAKGDGSHWYCAPAYGAASFALIWTLFVFTGIVTDRKLSCIIGTCYVFTFLAIAVSLVPFLFARFDPSDPGAMISLLRGCSADGDSVPAQVKCGTGSQTQVQWVVNVGGGAQQVSAATTPHDAAPARYQIFGGVVVPLYVIVLALMGSAISMTRRVPEYQRRAMSAQDPLTNVEAREKLVFQCMQVISAPLIAIAAYSIVKPAAAAEAVLVGFGSGFASEPILLMIRGMVEKISPDAAVTVKITPPSTTVKPGASVQFSAQVAGATNTTVSWEMDPPGADSGTLSKSGLYTAPADLKAEKTVTVTATSAADRNKFVSATIKVDPNASPAVDPKTDPKAAPQP